MRNFIDDAISAGPARLADYRRTAAEGRRPSANWDEAVRICTLAEQTWRDTPPANAAWGQAWLAADTAPARATRARRSRRDGTRIAEVARVVR